MLQHVRMINSIKLIVIVRQALGNIVLDNSRIVGLQVDIRPRRMKPTTAADVQQLRSSFRIVRFVVQGKALSSFNSQPTGVVDSMKKHSYVVGRKMFVHRFAATLPVAVIVDDQDSAGNEFWKKDLQFTSR